jgi:hypothetical protein
MWWGDVFCSSKNTWKNHFYQFDLPVNFDEFSGIGVNCLVVQVIFFVQKVSEKMEFTYLCR